MTLTQVAAVGTIVETWLNSVLGSKRPPNRR